MRSRTASPLLVLLLVTSCSPQAESDHSVADSPEPSSERRVKAILRCAEGEQPFKLDFLQDTISVPISEGLWEVELKLQVVGCTGLPLDKMVRDRVRQAFTAREELVLMLAFAKNRADPEFRGQVITVIEEALPGARVQALTIDIGTIKDHNIAGIPNASLSGR